jgi:glycosyltransferase involved in cell wall biosynthesis
MVLSVGMITYNHGDFIAQAIEGILMQKTNFDFELVIGEDFSKDNTREICIGYKNKYPDKIRLFLNEKNEGMTSNFIHVLDSCTGKYIAFCEGDDYWTDPYKLQKQVDFLEKHPGFSLCCHRYSILDTFDNTYKEDFCAHLFNPEMEGIEFSQKNFLDCWFSKTLTVVFRKVSLDMQKVTKYKYFDDVYLSFHILQHGKGFCLNFNAGVYTRHLNGVWTSLTKTNQVKQRYSVLKDLYENNQGNENIKKYYFSFIGIQLDKIIKSNRFPLLKKKVYQKILFFAKETKSPLLILKKIGKLFYYSMTQFGKVEIKAEDIVI